jgi:hypothetical protein
LRLAPLGGFGSAHSGTATDAPKLRETLLAIYLAHTRHQLRLTRITHTRCELVHHLVLRHQSQRGCPRRKEQPGERGGDEGGGRGIAQTRDALLENRSRSASCGAEASSPSERETHVAVHGSIPTHAWAVARRTQLGVMGLTTAPRFALVPWYDDVWAAGITHCELPVESTPPPVCHSPCAAASCPTLPTTRLRAPMHAGGQRSRPAWLVGAIRRRRRAREA